MGTDPQVRRDDAVVELIDAARELLGVRYGGAWIDRADEHRPMVGIAAVDPTTEIVEAILAIPRPPDLRISIHVVRYSYNELVGFVAGLSPPAEAAFVWFGPVAQLNRIVVGINTLDEESIAYFRDRIPDDALRFVVEPGTWVAAQGPSPTSAR